MDERTPNNQGFGATGAGSANTPPFEGNDLNPRRETARDLEQTRDTAGGSPTTGGLGSTGGLGATGGRTTGGLGGATERTSGGTMGDSMSGQTGQSAIAMNTGTQEDVGSRAREALGRAENQANEFLGRAAEGIDTAANRLDDLISQRTAGATGPTARAGEAANRVSDTLHSTADYLRTSDVDGLRTDLERQVRDNPLQTLLIGVAAGWLLGKILR